MEGLSRNTLQSLFEVNRTIYGKNAYDMFEIVASLTFERNVYLLNCKGPASSSYAQWRRCLSYLGLWRNQ